MASNDQLRRLRHWAGEYQVSLKDLMDAAHDGDLTVVQTSKAPNSPFKCKRHHIEEWLEKCRLSVRRAF